MKTQIHLTLNTREHEATARFTVRKVVNRTTPLPGDKLKKTEVDSLIDNDLLGLMTLTITKKLK